MFTRNELPNLAMVAMAGAVALSQQAAAQAVHGRVVEVGGERPVNGALVQLLDIGGTALRSTLTDSTGGFVIATGTSGTFRLRVSRIGYAVVETDSLTVASKEMVEVLVRISAQAVTIQPLVVIGRGVDARHLATYEGLYARRAVANRVGPERVVVRGDPEMQAALKVSDVTTGFGYPALCTAVFVDGRVVGKHTVTDRRDGYWVHPTAEEVLGPLTIPVELLEGVEFYRSYLYAPLEMRGASNEACKGKHSVLALWTRRPDGTREREVAEAQSKPVSGTDVPQLADTPALSIEVTVNRDAAPSRKGRIAGAVVDTNGGEVESPVVELLGPAGERFLITRAGVDGRFELMVPGPGQYRFRVLGSDGAWTSEVFNMPPEANVDVVLRVGSRTVRQ